ncbi:MAG: bifunctional 3,4-dihydroxy-2-butanone-4-phosphate synthase/GTP cyclohydrolase II [Bdellovibrionales bacterium]|nr:bifunctional 3,4-dihydroxy-2-butanone-4-phosphate synthase/GTP cyclohydrolase II [Bdellovibrionales bacterium]
MDHKDVLHAIETIKAGKMVILVDDEDRENEGDLVFAAEKVTPELINFMTKFGRGLVCLSMTEERCDQLELPPMVSHNTSRFSTAFTISIEAKEGISTGISAFDRAKTVATAIDDQCGPSDLARPGHIFPLRARKGGVLVRTGQTEGSVDLATLAGLKPAAVICEIMNEDGSMARMPELRSFSQKHNIPIVSVAQITAYRLQHESLVRITASAKLPSGFGGDWTLHCFENDIDTYEHIALVKGDLSSQEACLVRVHSECFTGDVLGSLRCDCQNQLHRAMEQIGKSQCGVLLYLRQEGRGIGLRNKIKAYALQDQGEDTVSANKKLGFGSDLREYGVGAQMLKALGVSKMKLLTNNPRKIIGLEGYGLEVTERVPIETPAHDDNRKYLQTKKDQLGHLLKIV